MQSAFAYNRKKRLVYDIFAVFEDISQRCTEAAKTNDCNIYWNKACCSRNWYKEIMRMSKNEICIMSGEMKRKCSLTNDDEHEYQQFLSGTFTKTIWECKLRCYIFPWFGAFNRMEMHRFIYWQGFGNWSKFKSFIFSYQQPYLSVSNLNHELHG